MNTPTEELRTAATRLRNDHNTSGYTLHCDSSELLDMIRVLLRARGPLIGWLEDATTLHLPDSECGYCTPDRNPLRLPCPPLAVARAVNGPARPGHAQGGPIPDHLTGGTR
ncbi:MAG TPA: hypothetical protein VFH77_17415 [Streptomyces sp.]|nr:hypothetical protein [Streptomyces sp.]